MSESIISCKICNRSFLKQYDLFRHEESKNCQAIVLKEDVKMKFEDSSIECEYCHKTFKKQSKLKTHLSTVQGDCYKIRNNTPQSIIINNGIINNKTVNNTINNNIAVKPIVNNIS